ncbi:phosphatase PAP2 family protein [Bacteroides sp. 224]|uniref:phosphatase PAP2 family protein n=1 Tax=Bacteroides sp. 224 TaxID=2302936 RepID=UPI0013D36765|nr:phosphatase PAP2 family protein [Bacteroides sp. 224]NDV64850.1 phosphatase PAP2 family protein [Bacteroides sp. 224]
MLEDILFWERKWFLAINNAHSSFLDQGMLLYSGMIAWIPFVVFLFFLLVYKKDRKEYLPVIIAIITVVLVGNLVSGLIFKPFFQRLRPTFHPDFVNEVKTVLGYTGGGLYGFISGHSTFSFGIATFTTLLFRYKPYGWTVFAWAIIMVYSRLYLGVHFLSDVLPGMITGMLIGWGVYAGFLYFRRKQYPEQQDHELSSYSGYRKRLLTIVLAGYILLIFLIGLIQR